MAISSSTGSTRNESKYERELDRHVKGMEVLVGDFKARVATFENYIRQIRKWLDDQKSVSQ